MQQYLDNLKFILETGFESEDRTGTGTITNFGLTSRYDLSKGFPLITTKKMFLKGIIHELLWFIKGDTNIKYLVDNDVHIWDEWAYERYLKMYEENKHLMVSSEALPSTESEDGVIPPLDIVQFARYVKEDSGFAKDCGDLGPIYGYQWRNFNSQDIDQLKKLEYDLKHNPSSRRHILTAWNPAQIKDMALPPCHAVAVQFHVNTRENTLSCELYQRSGDMFLGVPFNIASYALFTIMLAHVCGYEPGELIHHIGNAHIYKNHIDQVNLQLSRKPYDLPVIEILDRDEEVKSIFDFKYEHFKLHDYTYYPAIKAKVSV